MLQQDTNSHSGKESIFPNYLHRVFNLFLLKIITIYLIWNMIGLQQL